MDHFALRIAGLTVRVEARTSALRFRVEGPSRDFLVQDGPADLVLGASLRPLEETIEGALLFDSGGPWMLHQSGGRRVYRVFDRRVALHPYTEVRLDEGGTTGDLFLDPRLLVPRVAVDPLAFPLDELLFLELLSRHGGVELHACGVVDPSGRGHLFTGHSGDGKTTMARLWEEVPGATVLSDDRIVVRRTPDGRWCMYGTPWHGEAQLAASAEAVVAGIYVLGRGEENSLGQLSRADAVTALLARSFPPFHSPGALDSALSVLDGLVVRVPCRTFAFVPDPGAVRFVLEGAA